MQALVYLALFCSLAGVLAIVYGILRSRKRGTYLGLVLLVIGVIGMGILASQSALRGGLFDRLREQFGRESADDEPAFAVRTTLPNFTASLSKNSVVRIVFSDPLPSDAAIRLRVVRVSPKEDEGNEESVGGSVAVQNDPALSGGSFGSLVFEARESCGDALPATCFAPGVYRLELDEENLKNESGESLTCSDKYPCRFDFAVGEQTEARTPKLSLEKDFSLPISAETTIALGLTDAGRAYVRFTLDRGQVGERFLGVAMIEEGANAIALNTSDLQNNVSHFLTVEATNGTGASVTATTTFSAYQAHCFNEQTDGDEFSEDCGGQDCRACVSESL